MRIKLYIILLYYIYIYLYNIIYKNLWDLKKAYKIILKYKEILQWNMHAYIIFKRENEQILSFNFFGPFYLPIFKFV